MEYRTLGSTGTVVSTLCLGTMTFGAESDEKVAHEQLDRFVEKGGNFIDTADVYSGGESEKIIGRWLAARPGMRDRVVVATKGRIARASGPNDVGLSRVSLTRALDASLRRLGFDTIDLYQAHAWDPLTPIEETLRFFDDAVRAGKIHYVGRPAVTSVIVGARTLEQLDDNLGAAELHLTAEETAMLDEASRPIIDDYPYGDLGVSQRDRELPGPRA
jgi:aryl-alcohol dehydrogenase-like predicted oxidoreductase